MGSAAAPAAVRRALAPNSEASDHPKRLEQFAPPGEPRGRGSLHPRRARSPKPTSEFGSNSPRHSSHHARPSFPWIGQAHFHAPFRGRGRDLGPSFLPLKFLSVQADTPFTASRWRNGAHEIELAALEMENARREKENVALDLENGPHEMENARPKINNASLEMENGTPI